MNAKAIIESDEFQEAINSVALKELGFAEEKDISAYICRRHFNTEMRYIGCVRAERQYAMGHKFDDQEVDRRDFRNDDVLIELAHKLLKRPTVNPDILNEKEVNMEGDRYYNGDFHCETIRLPVRKGHYRICIESHEPITPATLQLQFPEGVKTTCRYYQQESNSKQRREVNVLNDYYEAFRRAYKEIEEENAKKES